MTIVFVYYNSIILVLYFFNLKLVTFSPDKQEDDESYQKREESFIQRNAL